MAYTGVRAVASYISEDVAVSRQSSANRDVCLQCAETALITTILAATTAGICEHKTRLNRQTVLSACAQMGGVALTAVVSYGHPMCLTSTCTLRVTSTLAAAVAGNQLLSCCTAFQ